MSNYRYYKRIEAQTSKGEAVVIFQLPDGSMVAEDSEVGAAVELRESIANNTATLVAADDPFPPESIVWRSTPRTAPPPELAREADGRLSSSPAPTTPQRIHHADRSATGGSAVEVAPTPSLEGLELPSPPISRERP